MTEDRLLSSKLRQRSPAARAFTLLELLVVIGIMGLLFSIGLPAFKGLNQSNLTVSVNRQLLDDLGYARMRAITERSDVYVVFVPTNIWTAFNTITDPNTRKRLTNLVTAQYSGYAILGTRTLGDQPGHATPHYLTEWRTLPEGYVFTPSKFRLPTGPGQNDPYNRSYAQRPFPFPDKQAPTPWPALPCIGFNALGQLISQRDETVAISKGNIMFPKDNNNRYIAGTPEVQLIPPRPDNVQYVRISWLTGRANAELPQFEK